MTSRTRRRSAGVVLGLSAALALAACSSSGGSGGSTGSSSQNTSSSSSSSSGGAGTSSSAPATADNKSFTIGFVEITEAAPVVLQTVAEFKRGAAMLGWTVKVANANGDPSQMAAGVSAMVNQNVDAIVTMAIPPSAAALGLQQAKTKGIPAIEIGAPVIDPNHLYGATYAPDDTKMASMVAAQMVKDLGGKGQLLELKASAQQAIVLRNQELSTAISGTGITIAASHETDLTNPVADTQSAVTNSLRAHSSINAVWAPQDFEFAPAVNTIVNQNLHGAGVYSIYLDPADFPLLRKHQVPMAIADSPLMDVSWYALDSLVNKLVLKKSDWAADPSIHPLPYVVITPANVPSGDTYPYADFAPFFQDRWKTDGITLKG